LFLQQQGDAAAAMTTTNWRKCSKQSIQPPHLYNLATSTLLISTRERHAGRPHYRPEEWIKSSKNQDIAVRFLRASIKVGFIAAITPTMR